jgi:hypothetical protein
MNYSFLSKNCQEIINLFMDPQTRSRVSHSIMCARSASHNVVDLYGMLQPEYIFYFLSSLLLKIISLLILLLL